MYFVYILTNHTYGTLYVGVTGNLLRRVHVHREGAVDGFTKRHGLRRLVWYEVHAEILSAIAREKSIKKWRRDWKINLIQAVNPDWKDLFEGIA